MEKKSLLFIDTSSTETCVVSLFSGVWPPADTITLVLYICCRVCCLTLGCLWMLRSTKTLKI